MNILVGASQNTTHRYAAPLEPTPAVHESGSAIPDQKGGEKASTREPREFFVEALMNTLPIKLSTERADLFPRLPRVVPFYGSGVTAIPFKVMSNPDGRYLLKIRPFFLDEVEAGRPSAALKEIWARDKAGAAGVLVPRGDVALTLAPRELPEVLDNIQVGFGGLVVAGRERPYVLSLQNFIDAKPARLSIEAEPVQQRALCELGQNLRKLTSIAVSGFGNNFDPETKAFKSSWGEYREQLQTVEKARILQSEGILSGEDVSVIEHLMTPLDEISPTAVLSHPDLNPGNYMIHPDGELAAIIDWDDVKGAPWQEVIAGAIGKIEASTFGVPSSSIHSRVASLLRGYGVGVEELRHEKPVIDAFRITEAIGFMHSFYVTFRFLSFLAEAHREITAGTYRRRDGDLRDIPASENDFRQSLLGSESVLRYLIAGSKEVTSPGESD